MRRKPRPKKAVENASEYAAMNELAGQTVVVIGGAGIGHERFLDELDFAKTRRNVDEMFWARLHIARGVAGKVAARRNTERSAAGRDHVHHGFLQWVHRPMVKKPRFCAEGADSPQR